ncbi:MAG: radical SAM protein, partial [Pseudomonadota bacterium]
MMEIQKFTDPFQTAKGETRASVVLKSLKTLWVNTGTRCNLSCENCYIESNPKNDRLVFFGMEDLVPYLDEIEDNHWATREVGFTGGEPLLNPQIIPMLRESL